jgi:alkanesulfonate monooxygenase SsuD/methylene tetrahydromethanopterin reductase-like flavin-dependent oxidoreductase (luciferase family)
MAAAVAVRTQRVRIRCRALILPLHDPVRIAEDAACVDVISEGRLELVVAAGYVASEFEMFGRTLGERGQLMEDGLIALRQAATGDCFDYRGRPARVALRPAQRSGVPLVMGGSSPAVARRAARLADGFEPNQDGLFEVYLAECERLGVQPGPPPRTLAGRFLYVAEEPERAWPELGRHLLHESRSYGQWLEQSGMGGQYRPVADLEELRTGGNYVVMTPEECVDLARGLGPEGLIELHPLVGGCSPELGWRCLQFFHTEVLPRLRAEGLYPPAGTAAA